MAEPRLLESALRRWWVVLIAFTITTVLTLIWVSPKPATYESSGTYVVQPRSQQPDDSVKALDTQIRGTQINATYALIARSDAIKNAAVSRLVRVPAHGHLHVEAEAVPGTNALTISRGRVRRNRHTRSPLPPAPRRWRTSRTSSSPTHSSCSTRRSSRRSR